MRGEPGGRSERFWEEHYLGHEQVWSGRPNPVLVDVVGSLPPGKVLDLGCGEGGDAVWLAAQGWRVTAADVSATALGRAAERAEAEGVAERIDFQQHDLEFTFPEGAFDLVSAQYLHSPVEFPACACPAKGGTRRGARRPPARRRPCLGPAPVLGRPQHPLPHPGGSARRNRPRRREVAHREDGRSRATGNGPWRSDGHRHRQRHSPQTPRAVWRSLREEAVTAVSNQQLAVSKSFLLIADG